MRLTKLVEEKQLGSGWVKALLTDCSVNPGLQRCMIERPGHRDAYLSTSGWRGSVHFIDVELLPGAAENEKYFLFKPEVVQFMSASANYQLSIVDQNGTALAKCGLSWKGVRPYLPPQHGAGVIGTSSAPAIETTPPVVEVAPVQAEPPVKSPTDPMEGLTGWGVGSQISEIDEPVEPAEPLAPVIEPSVPTVPSEIFKVDCPFGASSPFGPHKIFSNTVFCPICSKHV